MELKINPETILFTYNTLTMFIFTAYSALAMLTMGSIESKKTFEATYATMQKLWWAFAYTSNLIFV